MKPGRFHPVPARRGLGLVGTILLILQNGTGCVITKWNNFIKKWDSITKWDNYYKVVLNNILPGEFDVFQKQLSGGIL